MILLGLIAIAFLLIFRKYHWNVTFRAVLRCLFNLPGGLDSLRGEQMHKGILTLRNLGQDRHVFGNKHTLPFIVFTCTGIRGSGHLAEAGIPHHWQEPGGIRGESNGILMICSL